MILLYVYFIYEGIGGLLMKIDEIGLDYFGRILEKFFFYGMILIEILYLDYLYINLLISMNFNF